MRLEPKKLYDGLIRKGYSEYSANILVSQYFQDPDDPRKWGTENQTRKDIKEIIKA